MRMVRWRSRLACGAALLALASCRSDSASKPPLVNLLQNGTFDDGFGSPMYEYMKRLVAIRRQYLSSDLTQHWISNDQGASVYSSLSVSGKNRVVTVANFSSASKTVTLTLNDPELRSIGGITDLLHDTTVTYDGGGYLALTLEGRGTAILLVSSVTPAR